MMDSVVSCHSNVLLALLIFETMKYNYVLSVLITILLYLNSLYAQIDPAAMATLSKLSHDQRQQLIKKYGSSGEGLANSVPTAKLPNRSVKVEESRGGIF